MTNLNTTEPISIYDDILATLRHTYMSKNADYGDSFNKSIKKYGPIAGLVRISDKFNRLENLLMGNDAKVKDERVEDTLLDLANYCIMLKMAI